jgi:predicted tellurium resistance membrane protein TerC
MYQWIIDNKEWLFSGAGILVVTFVIGLFYQKKKRQIVVIKEINNSKKMNQRGGKHSTNYQSSGNMHIGTGDD